MGYQRHPDHVGRFYESVIENYHTEVIQFFVPSLLFAFF